MPIELLIVVIVKALLELAGLFILGQGALDVIAGKNRARNPIYQLFQIVTRPLYTAVRFVAPAAVIDRHIPSVTLLVLVWAWLFVMFWLLPDMCTSGRYDCRPLLERKQEHDAAADRHLAIGAALRSSV